MELHLQKALRGGMSLESLIGELGVHVSHSLDYPGLVLFKYSQTKSPMGHPIVQECRGVILNESKDWDVVARPFDKFFNMGDSKAAPINWGTAVVTEKLDGSLCSLFHFQGKWNVATSGHPDAIGTTRGGPMIRDLFWGAFETLGDTPILDQDLTYIFELTSKYNKMVVQYDQPRITLIGVRNRVTGEYLPLEGHGFPVVKSFPIKSAQEALASFRTMDPTRQEGYVVRDALWNMVKVKHPGYVAIHHVKGESFTREALLEVVRSGECDEFLLAFPVWKEETQELKSKYDDLVLSLEQAFDRISHIQDRKEFSVEANKTQAPTVLYALKKDPNVDVRDILSNFKLGALMKCLS